MQDKNSQNYDNFIRNKSQGYFSHIGNSIIPQQQYENPQYSSRKVQYPNSNDIHYQNYKDSYNLYPQKSNHPNLNSQPQLNSLQVNYPNPNDIHYYNYKQPQQIQQPPPQQPKSINVSFPEQQPQYQPLPIQQPQQYNMYSIQQQQLQNAEQNNAMLKARMFHKQYEPPNDILSFIGKRVNNTPLPNQPYYYPPPPPQQPRVVIVNDNHGRRRRTPPRQEIIYQQLPPQIIYQKVEPEKHIIKEIIRENVISKGQKGGRYSIDTLSSSGFNKHRKSKRGSKRDSKRKSNKKEKDIKDKLKKSKGHYIKIVFKSLTNYAGNKTIYTKHAITYNEDFEKDVDGNPCSGESQIDSKKKGKEMLFDYEHTYKVDYPKLAEEIEDDKQVFIFIAMYDTNQTELIGWAIQPIFIYTEEDKVQVNRGIFKQNLFDPPLQGPPFLAPKEKSNKIFEFAITDEFNDVDSLQLIDLQEEILSDDGKFLELTIKSINGYPNINFMKFQIEINDPENTILDRDQKLCISQGEFTKNFDKLNHKIRFNAGETYLRNITDPISRSEYIISINFFSKENDPIGFVDIPLFESQVALYLGEYTEPIEEPEEGDPEITVELKLVK